MMKTITAKCIHTISKKLEVILFNVGQGDHILLKFPTSEYGIIDFHYETSNNIVEPPCLSYFKELKRTLSKEEFEAITISFFCISHTDKDHVKGISETIEWFHDNGVFIKEFWLGAAKSESQLNSFLRVKVNSLIDTFNLDEKLRYNSSVDSYNNGLETFFKYFEKWKNREFKSTRYKYEKIGVGEYLAEIRLLSPPCTLGNSKAVNLGPLISQLDAYSNNLNLDIIKKILKVKDNSNLVDKNLMSHIINIKFGDTNLLFGGDTDKDIWNECLAKYLEPANMFTEIFGNIDSHFIKVSHHGSSNSSSPSIWKNIISKGGNVYLGISAGRNKSYLHPHSDTLKEVRDCRSDSNIISTNICNSCIASSSFDKEHHSWYDNFISRSKNYGKEKSNPFDVLINQEISKSSLNTDLTTEPITNMGLFAYIFEIPDNLNEEIKVRIALTNTNKSHDCFFTGHTEKLFSYCL